MVEIGLLVSASVSLCELFGKLYDDLFAIICPLALEHFVIDAKAEQPVALDEHFVDSVIGRMLCRLD